MFNLFPKKKSVDKIIKDADLTPAWQWTPTQTPSMLQAQNELIEQFLKENHDLKLEKQKLKAELDKWEKDWDEQNKNVSELMKEINGLRHLKEENVKHLEYIKNLREQQEFLYKENEKLKKDKPVDVWDALPDDWEDKLKAQEIEKLKKKNLELIERVNEIDNDVIRDLQDEIFVLKNDYAVLKAQKHPMYPLHWMGLDPLIHEQAKDLTIEQAIDKVKQKTPWVEEPIDWNGDIADENLKEPVFLSCACGDCHEKTKQYNKQNEKYPTWEEVASDLALRVTQLEQQLKYTQKIVYKDDPNYEYFKKHGKWPWGGEESNPLYKGY